MSLLAFVWYKFEVYNLGSLRSTFESFCTIFRAHKYNFCLPKIILIKLECFNMKTLTIQKIVDFNKHIETTEHIETIVKVIKLTEFDFGKASI